MNTSSIKRFLAKMSPSRAMASIRTRLSRRHAVPLQSQPNESAISPIEHSDASIKAAAIQCSDSSPIDEHKSMMVVVSKHSVFLPAKLTSLCRFAFLKKRSSHSKQSAQVANFNETELNDSHVIIADSDKAKDELPLHQNTMSNLELTRQRALNEHFFGTTVLIHRF